MLFLRLFYAVYLCPKRKLNVDTIIYLFISFYNAIKQHFYASFKLGYIVLALGPKHARTVSRPE